MFYAKLTDLPALTYFDASSELKWKVIKNETVGYLAKIPEEQTRMFCYLTRTYRLGIKVSVPSNTMNTSTLSNPSQVSNN
jgi:hypothetical protein